MPFKLAAAALFIIAMLPGCGGVAAAPRGLPQLSGRVGALAGKNDPPFAYVAERCETSSSCSDPNGLVQMLGGAAITIGIEDPDALALDGSGNVYVGNATASNAGDVGVYGPKGVNPLRTLGGITGVPKGLVANEAGRLYVVAQYRSGCCELVGTGGVYAPDKTEPQRALKGLSGFAHSPVLDASGNLYVGNFDVFPGWVSVYEPGKRKPSRVIDNGIGLPIQLAIAPNGDLVVLNGLFSGGYDVVSYPAGQGSPSLTITAGLHASTSVAVDAGGNIYVANGRDKRLAGSITVYRSGQTSVWRTIHAGISFPAALAFDASGRLYVANVPRKKTNTIVVYASGGSRPVRTYRLSEEFSALAVPQ